MRKERTFHEFVEQRQISEMVMKRLIEHVYDRPLINNVERADYIECLVELVMKSADPRWRLTQTWDQWDVEHALTGARIEVKQSSALQSWDLPNQIDRASTARLGATFDIAGRDWYWGKCPGGKYHNVPVDSARLADVYVFAWHGETDRIVADHRQASQWQFFVVSEQALPPGQKSISLNPLRALAELCDYRGLAGTVIDRLPNPPDLKANLTSPLDPCQECRPP